MGASLNIICSTKDSPIFDELPLEKIEPYVMLRVMRMTSVAAAEAPESMPSRQVLAEAAVPVAGRLPEAEAEGASQQHSGKTRQTLKRSRRN